MYKNITTTIGNTPIVQLNNLTKNIKAKIGVKLEFFNPMSSIKDRIGVAMIDDAEKKRKLKKGGTIVEPTSGNTGIALAFVSAARGYKIILTMPDTVSVERQKILKLLGAKLILTPGSKGMKGAIEKATQIKKTNPYYFMPNQFENSANPKIHRKTTAKEIWKDTKGGIDIFVAGIGTGGTITGVGEVLKKLNPKIKIIAVEPEASAVLSGKNPGPHGIQGIGAGFIPKVLNTKIYDQIITVKEKDAKKTALDLAKKEGLFAGISSGANVFAALKLAKLPKNKGKLIITILPDTMERYLSIDLSNP